MRSQYGFRSAVFSCQQLVLFIVVVASGTTSMLIFTIINKRSHVFKCPRFWTARYSVNDLNIFRWFLDTDLLEKCPRFIVDLIRIIMLVATFDRCDFNLFIKFDGMWPRWILQRQIIPHVYALWGHTWFDIISPCRWHSLFWFEKARARVFRDAGIPALGVRSAWLPSLALGFHCLGGAVV